jgi:hypothetical protein
MWGVKAKVRVKVKHAMKFQRGTRDIAILFNLGAR